MVRNSLLCLAFVASVSPLVAGPDVKLDPIYTGVEIERPVSLQIPADGTNRRFLVEQTGKIKILPADENSADATVFLDLTESIGVEKNFEEGLLGLAFHPDYKNNGKLYLTFSRQGPKRLVLAEYSVSKDDPNAADPESERVLLEIQQPEWNHNSGNLLFDPKDGKLFLCAGDGGLKNGVFMLPQKLTRWNGKVLRIDVDSRSGNREYGIPDDNPFLDNPIACPEIWAYGLRNPWGASIDPVSGLFYLADVGQDIYEEIDLIEKGGNYGWEYREGFHEFAPRADYMRLLARKPDFLAEGDYIDPIHEYTHAEGLSITGGFVYRGEAIPDLQGCYLYGDWKFGTLWALRYDPEAKKVVSNETFEKADNPAEPTVQPTGFYPDEKGEAIVLGHRGKMFRIVPGS